MLGRGLQYEYVEILSIYLQFEEKNRRTQCAGLSKALTAVRVTCLTSRGCWKGRHTRSASTSDDDDSVIIGDEPLCPSVGISVRR